jgi:GNAT superfamily N-acetyltransferase
MSITIARVHADDDQSIDLIANWYASEWTIPIQTTVDRLKTFDSTGIPLHIIVKENDIPVATGGIYTDNGVGLLRVKPEYKVYPHWLSLVYTLPEKRGTGIGTILCSNLEEIAQAAGLHKLHLYTNTPTKLYLRRQWKPIERINYQNQDTVIMEKVF